MAQSPAKVEKFLDSLFEKMHKQQVKESNELTEFAREATGNKSLIVQPWDVTHYHNLYKLKKN